MRRGGPGEAWLLLALTTLFWAGNAVIARALQGAFPPVTLSFLRWVIALALVLPFAAGALWRARETLRRHWRPLVALGVFGAAGYTTLLYVAVQTTTATSAVLINATTPVLILVLGRIVFGTPLRGLQLAGVATSFAGALVLVARGDLQVLTGLSFNPGDLWLVAAALSWAAYTLLLRYRPPGLDALSFLTATLAVAVAVLAPLSAWEVAQGGPLQFGMPVVAGLAYFAVFPSVLAYLFWNRGVEEVGANVAGLFVHLMPVFGIVLAWLFLGEGLAPFHVAGIALILTGIWLTSRYGRRRPDIDEAAAVGTD